LTELHTHLLVFGMGYSALAAARLTKADFQRITGTSRSEEKCAILRKEGFEMIRFDGSRKPDLDQALETVTHILVSIAPGDEDPVLSAFPHIGHLAPNLKWIGYLSTVGVYGNHDGAWVDEDTQVRPVSARSKQRVAAENAWMALGTSRDVPVTVLRLSGIYGPGRNAFINIEKDTARRLVKPGQVFNRIHRDDIASAVKASIKCNADGLFNITDDAPAPPQDVVQYAHELWGKEPPPEIDFHRADLSPMARSFYGENKRVSNARSKSELGLRYAYPDYRTALSRMWKENSWRS